MTTSLPRLLGAILLSAASISSCRCIDHPLYDWKVNRYDGYYLGGGNSQNRPWPGGHMERDPRAGAIDLVLAGPDGPDGGALRLQVLATDDATLSELEAELVVTKDGELIGLGRFESRTPDLLELQLELDQNQPDGDAWILFYDHAGTEFSLGIAGTELAAAMDALNGD